MTGKERMLKTLRFEEPDRPPHFETMFELEKEAFGLQFPDRRLWEGCAAAEKRRMIDVCMEIYVRIVERYQWDALAVYWPWSDPDGVAAAKKTFGEQILIGSMVGDTVWSIEHMHDWTQFAVDLVERPAHIHAVAEEKTAAGDGQNRPVGRRGGRFRAPGQRRGVQSRPLCFAPVLWRNHHALSGRARWSTSSGGAPFPSSIPTATSCRSWTIIFRSVRPASSRSIRWPAWTLRRSSGVVTGGWP